MKDKLKNTLKQTCVFSFKDTLLSFVIIIAAAALCFLFRVFDQNNNYVSMIFILAVFLIARFTNGYFYGILSSLISVLAVNFIFTYPFFRFNFTLAGYPIVILSMLAVSLITSTLTSQAKLNQSIKIESEREKTRSNLLRAVSHDLRTPLTSILGSTSAIIENDDSLSKAQRTALLCEVRDDSQWLIRMVENLLTITRIDGENTNKITKRNEAAEELVSDAVSKFKKRFPNQTVCVKVPNDLLMVPVDGVLIEQVIINLLENAVIHGKSADKIMLEVKSSDNIAIFTVSDNGEGIAPDILPHIFEGYFKKSYEQESDSKKNMGIGLSVCNTIINAHNGKMFARNLPDSGAEFSFELPLKER